MDEAGLGLGSRSRSGTGWIGTSACGPWVTLGGHSGAWVEGGAGVTATGGRGSWTNVEQAGRKVSAITDAGRDDLAANRRAVDDFYDHSGTNRGEAYAEDFAEPMHGVARLVKAFATAVGEVV